MMIAGTTMRHSPRRSSPVVQTWKAAVKSAGSDPDAVLKGLKDELAESNSGF